MPQGSHGKMDHDLDRILKKTARFPQVSFSKKDHSFTVQNFRLKRLRPRVFGYAGQDSSGLVQGFQGILMPPLQGISRTQVAENGCCLELSI